MTFYRALAHGHDTIHLAEAGTTDSGEPMHLVTWAADGDPVARPLPKRTRAVVFIINAIHPGEPDGVDASAMLLRDLASHGGPENVLVAVVPVYNVGGALNRNSTTRANQNGPAEYGFRGNARNLDLNRDFMKADSRNAQSFARLLHRIDPDVFVDTHVSNGADYQHVMTLLVTQKDKLAAPLGDFIDGVMVPALTRDMARLGEYIVPYVNLFGRPPDEGWTAFLDGPRYSSGYAAQFQTLAFMTEAHMLKPYEARVRATQRMLEAMVYYSARERDAIHAVRREARASVAAATELPIAWQVRRDGWTDVDFRGYEAREASSQVTGLQRLLYDRERPWRRKVRFYNDFEATESVVKPVAYLVPRGHWPVLERLENAGVAITRLAEDTTLRVQRYRIEDYATSPSPYEGRFPHRDTRVTTQDALIVARAGDALVKTGTGKDQFVVNALEPRAADSYFNWNFFDAVLQRKEYFSGYVFEDVAARLLAERPELAEALARRREEDAAFAADARAQLRFVYERSAHAEAAYRLYPVYRVMSLEAAE